MVQQHGVPGEPVTAFTYPPMKHSRPSHKPRNDAARHQDIHAGSSNGRGQFEIPKSDPGVGVRGYTMARPPRLMGWDPHGPTRGAKHRDLVLGGQAQEKKTGVKFWEAKFWFRARRLAFE